MILDLNDLPPGMSAYTLFVAATPDVLFEESESCTVVAPARAPEPSYRASMVLQTARDLLVMVYGPTVEARLIIDWSEGVTLYDYRLPGFRPIPVVPPKLLALVFDRPYDAFIDLCQDEHCGRGTGLFLDHLTKEG